MRDNLLAHPNTTVEIGDRTLAVTARVLDVAEIDAVIAKQAAVRPQFADYETRTTRTILVIELQRVDGGD